VKIKNNSNIDGLDKKILLLLSRDARMPYLEVARQCKLSGAAIHQRMRRLKDIGIISGSQININLSSIGYPTCAYIGIQINLLSSRTHPEVFKKISEVPEIVECYHITGKYSLFIKVFAQSNEHLKEIIVEKIQSIIEVTSTETFICLEEGFQRQLPFDTEYLIQ
jgi:Lrp/AsnC family transcriptional regulator for asnA, asnC and gidA